MADSSELREPLKVILRSYDADPYSVPSDMFDKEADEILALLAAEKQRWETAAGLTELYIVNNRKPGDSMASYVKARIDELESETKGENNG